LRLRARGLSVMVTPAAICRHIGGASVGRASRAAAAGALRGHLRLVGPSPLRRALVVLLAVAQIVKERGPATRLLGLVDGFVGGEREQGVVDRRHQRGFLQQ
jgi:hypothetical protein